MGRVLAIRLLAAAILALSGIVVLGICAHVETNVRSPSLLEHDPAADTLLPDNPYLTLDKPQIRNLGLSTSLYTFGAFLGALTLVVELAFAATRFWFPDSKPAYLVSEVAANAVLWIFWVCE